LLTHRSSRAPSSNWERRKGEGRGKKEERKGKGERRERESVGRDRNEIKRGKEGADEGRKHHLIFTSLRYSPPQMLDLSSRLVGRGVQHGEGKRKGEGKKGEIGNGGVALAPREKFMRAPMLQFIGTKLV